MRSTQKPLGYISIVVGLLVIFIIFLISPTKNISLSDEVKQPVDKLTAIEKPKVIGYNRQSSRLEFEIDFSKQDLEKVIYNSIKKDMRVDGLCVDIQDSNIKVYINTYLLDFIKMQYNLQLMPYIKDNTLAFRIEKVKVGRVNIPQKIAISKIKKLNLNDILIDDNSIILQNMIVKPFKFSDVYVNDGKLKVKMSMEIKIVEDIKDLFSSEKINSIKIFIESLLKDILNKYF